jgi:hypothetical protein
MGSGKMDQWSIGKKPFLTGKLINGKVSFNINIPLFHHSIIPDARQEYLPQPPPVNSMSCRNSETFNY